MYMKKTYFLVTLAFTLFVSATAIKAGEFMHKSAISKVSAVAAPAETFFSHLTSVPFEPSDSVDMSNSTLAPSVYYSCFSNSYPTKGYEVTLATPGTISLSASSRTITTGNYAFMVTSNYNLSNYVYLINGNGTTSSLSAATYYITLLTNQKYGKFKLNIASTASITTELGNTENNQIQLYNEKNAIVAKGFSPESVIKIYNTNGQLLKSVVSTSGSEVIAMPNKGIYIVKVNSVSKKIIIL